jgi:hypothetical protein
MVPARVERAASAPDTLVTTTRTTKTAKLVSFRLSKISSAVTETPATIKDKL